MEVLTNQVVEGFTPQSIYRVRGVGYASLRGPDGVQLDMSEQGMTELGTSAEFAELLGRMGAFIAEHDGYKEPGHVMLAEPVEPLTLSHPFATGGNITISEYERNDPIAIRRYESPHVVSIYRPRLHPDVAIKAYDGESKLAPVQFYVGNLLHKCLGYTDGNVTFPRQLAMFTSRGKHRTVVMDFVPGETLRAVCENMTDGGYEEATVARFEEMVRFRIKKVAREQLGERSFFFVDDLKTQENIILDTTEPIDPHGPIDGPIGLIDQPSMAPPMSLIWQALQRKLSSHRWQASLDGRLAQPTESTA